jgi:uncharacterized protein
MSQESSYSTPEVGEQRRAFYRRLAQDAAAREQVQAFVIPKETGKAFVVQAGQILRVIDVEGSQVADFNAFNRHDPREMFWSGRTRILEGAHLTVGHQLWSTPPRMRPLFTIIADTVDHKPLPHRAASHDLLYARCNERLFEVVAGQRGRPSCQDNLAAAVKEFGLTPDYIHDAFNLFMTTGINDSGRLFFLEPDAKKGDYVELHAEMECIVAISACPGGCNGPQNKAIEVQIYRHSLQP